MIDAKRAQAMHTLNEVRESTLKVLKENPFLTHEGFECYTHQFEHQYGTIQGWRDSIPHRQEQLTKEDRLKEILASLMWLDGVSRTKTIRYHTSSYGLKHIVEDSTFADICDRYVANGCFIVAALILQFQYARLSNSFSYNAYFNMPKKDIRGKIKEFCAKDRIPINL